MAELRCGRSLTIPNFYTGRRGVEKRKKHDYSIMADRTYGGLKMYRIIILLHTLRIVRVRMLAAACSRRRVQELC